MSTCTLPLGGVAFPGEWADRGACRTVPTEVFFPGRGASTETAKAVCRSCPVLEDCREYALAVVGLKGVWGGLAEVERKRLRAARAATPPPPRPPRDAARARPPRRSPLYRALEELTASPGRWAQVVWYPGPHTAAAMTTRLRAGALAAPEGRWRFEAVPSDGGSALRAYCEAGRRVGAQAG
jgi:WhiB family transcriptional regulator, redox-sensing transcriptional regulator